MPRQSSRRSAPAPAARRPMSTTAAPPARHQAPPPPVPAQQQPVIVQGQQPSLFGQMASTAAGVAVGSTVGHALGGALGGLFGGSSSAPAVEQPQAAAPLAPQQSSYAYSNNNQQSGVCDVDARNFTKCLDDNAGNMQICDWYLQQLKACQEMSRNY
ncbi:hypothetical protein V1509DRAFT_625891 [Lipomyces kononenkoae]